MTDDRSAPQHGPAPQYGEYATPEQQAAAMGRDYVPSAPVPVGIPSAGPSTSSGTEATSSGTNAVPGSGHFIDRFVTAFQLGIGVLALVTSDWFHLAEDLNTAFVQAGVATRISTSLDRYGWVLLGANILFLLATIVWASATLRRGRRAYYIPFVGYLAFTVVVGGIFAYVFTR